MLDLLQQQLVLLGAVALAGVLGFLIGLEREYYAKSAGMRTYCLVGMGSALFTVISKYGFLDTVMGDFSRFDGSRVAAQIVTGIGFLGAGLIFVRRDTVRGLTTAAGIWVVAGVGMACGVGLYLLAIMVTALYMAAVFGIRPLAVRMPHAKATVRSFVIRYEDGRGVLREIMEKVATLGLQVSDMRVQGAVDGKKVPMQEICIELHGMSSALDEVEDELGDVPGVRRVYAQSSRVPCDG
ncbi:MAG: MgtC/SapB family protein [Propionibacteriaceae bacterium]|jgi:putative Mg2+ transporter-C (MgtC) family protein|nr:MgtC/SapB family protein [Propionibacteriaceae bacterium]